MICLKGNKMQPVFNFKTTHGNMYILLLTTQNVALAYDSARIGTNTRTSLRLKIVEIEKVIAYYNISHTIALFKTFSAEVLKEPKSNTVMLLLCNKFDKNSATYTILHKD